MLGEEPRGRCGGRGLGGRARGGYPCEHPVVGGGGEAHPDLVPRDGHPHTHPVGRRAPGQRLWGDLPEAIPQMGSCTPTIRTRVCSSLPLELQTPLWACGGGPKFSCLSLLSHFPPPHCDFGVLLLFLCRDLTPFQTQIPPPSSIPTIAPLSKSSFLLRHRGQTESTSPESLRTGCPNCNTPPSSLLPKLCVSLGSSAVFSLVVFWAFSLLVFQAASLLIVSFLLSLWRRGNAPNLFDLLISTPEDQPGMSVQWDVTPPLLWGHLVQLTFGVEVPWAGSGEVAVPGAGMHPGTPRPDPCSVRHGPTRQHFPAGL